MLDETFRHVAKRDGRKRKRRSMRPNPKSTPKEIAGSHGHRPAGPSILWPALYRHLRQKGYSKAKAAAISNAGWKKKRMGIPTNTPMSARGLAKDFKHADLLKGQPDSRDVSTERPLRTTLKTRRCEKCGYRHKGECKHKAKKADETITSEISKVDDEKQVVFGWAYVTHDAMGELNVDKSGEFIDSVDELEDMAYGFVLKARTGDADHTNVQSSTLVESIVFTPEKIEAMGLQKGDVPVGWWTGWKIHDDEVWKGVKDGKYTAFSIFGKATKKDVSS